MKIDKILQEAIKIKLNPRRPLFYARVKMLIWSKSGQWLDNCSGMLIFYVLNNSYYLAIINIIKFQVDFDMEIYTNFMKFTKFMGETCSVQFIVPTQAQNFVAMFALQSKQQLTQLKRKLQSQFYKSDNVQQLQFFQRPQVQQLIKEAEISDQTLQTHMKLRNQVEAKIKQYFNEIENLQKTKKNSGFKAYGLGREEWKLEQSQKQFLKEKKKGDVIANLARLNKQNKML